MDGERRAAPVADPTCRLHAAGGGVVTGFLNRLAGIALGNPAPSEARVALPPRFAPPQPLVGTSQGRQAPDEPAAALETLPAAPATLASERARATRQGETLAQASGMAVPPSAGMASLSNPRASNDADASRSATIGGLLAKSSETGTTGASPAAGATARDVAAPGHPPRSIPV